MFNLKNNILLKIGLILVILIIVAYVYSSLTENKKFTDSTITFDYPCFFIPQHGESTGSTMQKVAYFTSGDPFNSQNILATKNKTAISASKLRDDAVYLVKIDQTAKYYLNQPLLILMAYLDWLYIIL